jgi:hypothetical protein
MPGEDSADNRPPAHKVEVVTGDRDNTGVYTEENQISSPDHYVVNHDVCNYRDRESEVNN